MSVVTEEDDSQADDAIESVKGDIEPTEAAMEIEEADNAPAAAQEAPQDEIQIVEETK